MIAIGIDVAEIKDRQTNSDRTDLIIPDFPSEESANPARFAIMPANAEKNVIAIN